MSKCLGVGVRLNAQRRFYSTLESAHRCPAIEPEFGVTSGTSTLKHVLVSLYKLDWSASHREARTRDIFCLLGDSHDTRQHFSISIYPLWDSILGNQAFHTYLKSLSQSCIAPQLPSSALSLPLPSSNFSPMGNSFPAASCTLGLRAMEWF